MLAPKSMVNAHQKGEEKKTKTPRVKEPLVVDTYAGKVQVRWEPDAAVSALGQMPFFIEFLKTAELFDRWVEDCPVRYRSPNAPRKRDVLGTILLSVLAGHWRYAHISALRGDGVNPALLGMKKVASEDSVRRMFTQAGVTRAEWEQWLSQHLRASYEPLLVEPWILDVDSTVKPLYGHQEEAKVGYNPHKPGRPSHVYHSYFVGGLRLVLDVEVQAGNQTAPVYAQPGLWKFIDGLPTQNRPALLRGDCHWGSEKMMLGAEQRCLAYLFKLRQTKNVTKLIERLIDGSGWEEAGQGWQGVSCELQLQGWSRARRVVVLRRRVREKKADSSPEQAGAAQLILKGTELMHHGVLYEYAVLVTSLSLGVLSVAQLYRDRGDAENNYDELKNQWGWSGYTTHDHQRCAIMARIIALIYNWWTLYTRLVTPDQHAEAITSRPLLLHGIARQTRHSHQTTVTITSTHAQASAIEMAVGAVSRFLNWVKTSAEQLTTAERWRLILSRAFDKYLHGKGLGGIPRLAVAPT
jgi:hypothetical protein